MSQLQLFAPAAPIAETDRIAELIRRGALFVVNHSGGKDSQAMLIELRKLVPAERLVIVHAELPEADWEGVREHVEATAFGVPVYHCRAERTFFGMVEARIQRLVAKAVDASPWPSPKFRECTSYLKRSPLQVLIRRIARERGARLIVSCEGIRAEESTDRAKRGTLAINAELTKAGREVYDWLPIHSMTLAKVWDTIASAGQMPHWAYAEGMSRLSCVFCIMASKADQTTAARLRPALYRRYVELERATGKTMSMSRRTLPEITGIPA